MDLFAYWSRLGFGADLLPIVPPDAEIHPDSKVRPEHRGKVPGRRGAHGLWTGYADWRHGTAGPGDWAAWDRMGASVGLRLGGWIAVDVDILDPEIASAVVALARGILGGAPLRVGRAPKALLLYRRAAGETMDKHDIVFEVRGQQHRVEVLADGQQCVVAGVHPVTRQPYRWEGGEPLAVEVPTATVAGIGALLDAIGELAGEMGGHVVRRAKHGTGSNRLDVDQAALRAPSAALLAEAAPHVANSGGYDDWIRGLAAWRGAATGVLDDEGEALARDWTERWDGSGAGGGPAVDFETKWRQITPPFAAGWPQVERAARAGGWFGGVEHEVLAALPGGAEALKQMAAEADETRAALAESGETVDQTMQEAMFARYVWVEASERVGDLETKALLTRTQFNARLAEVGPPHDSRRCAWAQFLEAKHGERRCRHAVAPTYRPGAGALVEEPGRGVCFNTWRPSALRPAAGDVGPWLDLAERVLPDPRERGLLLDWLAWLIQRPGVKPRFGVVFGGEQGVGKDSLLLPVVRALGQHNVQNITVEDLTSTQTDWVASAQLVVVGEMHSFSRREMGDKLKPLLVAPPDTLRVNIKYLPVYAVPNVIALMMFTNHLDALSIEDSDRRLLCLWSPLPNPDTLEAAEKRALDEWFLAYHDWRERPGAAGAGVTGDQAVAAWLARRDLTAFERLTRSPATAAKAEMREAGRSEAVAALEDALEGMDLPDLVSPGDVAARLSARGGKFVSGHAVARALRGRGGKQITPESVAVPASAVASGAKRVRIWATRNVSAYETMPPAAVARKYAEMWAATRQDIELFFGPKDAAPHSESGE